MSFMVKTNYKLIVISILTLFFLTISIITQAELSLSLDNKKDVKIIEKELYPIELLKSIGQIQDNQESISKIKEIATNTKKEEIKISEKTKEIAIKEIDKKISTSNKLNIIIWVKKDYNYKNVIEDLKNFKIKYEYDQLNGFAGVADKETIKALKKDKRVDYISFDAPIKSSLRESAHLIQADILSTNFSLRGQGLGICHLDSGINYNVPELAHAYAGGYDFVNNDSDPFDDNGHGTVTAGVIVSNDLINKGIAPEANLYVGKVLNSSGFGFASSFAAGINWCIANKNSFNLSVISASIATFETYNQQNSPGYSEVALEAAYNENIPVVACTGNTKNLSGVAYPAVSPYVIPVSGVYDSNVGTFNYFFNNLSCSDQTTSADQIPCFANRADFVKLLAPASIITTTSWFGGTMNISGTSVASPHVASTIALMKQRNPQITISQIKEILESTGVNVQDPSTGLSFKRINALEAVKATPYLTKLGNLTQGSNISLEISDPMNPGAIYFTLLSFGNSLGVPLSNGLVLKLDADGLFSYSLIYPNPILLNNIGILDNNGKATTTFLVPQLPGIENLTIYSGFATARPDLSEFLSVSNIEKL